MGYPDDYPDDLRNSIFAWSGDSNGAGGHEGELTFVFTRAGDRLKVYVLQYLGHLDGLGGLYVRAGSGSIGDLHYNPRDEGSFPPEDISWSSDGHDFRVSRPLRDWLHARDMYVENRERLLRLVAQEGRFDISHLD
jgi:hypothetical protein